VFASPGPIRLTDLGPRDGVLRGEVGRLHFEARLTRGPVSYGIDPATLYKGYGRIARLVLYEPVPGTGVYRKLAVFDRGWAFGRKQSLSAVSRLVAYLERT